VRRERARPPSSHRVRQPRRPVPTRAARATWRGLWRPSRSGRPFSRGREHDVGSRSLGVSWSKERSATPKRGSASSLNTATRYSGSPSRTSDSFSTSARPTSASGDVPSDGCTRIRRAGSKRFMKTIGSGRGRRSPRPWRRRLSHRGDRQRHHGAQADRGGAQETSAGATGRAGARAAPGHHG